MRGARRRSKNLTVTYYQELIRLGGDFLKIAEVTDHR